MAEQSSACGSLDEQIVYWRTKAREAKSDVWLIALGVAYGMTMAKEYLEAKDSN